MTHLNDNTHGEQRYDIPEWTELTPEEVAELDRKDKAEADQEKNALLEYDSTPVQNLTPEERKEIFRHKMFDLFLESDFYSVFQNVNYGFAAFLSDRLYNKTFETDQTTDAEAV